jgi:roundabout axon guidance receptor 2
VCVGVNSVGSVSTRVMLNINIESDMSLPPPIIAFGPQNQTLPIKSVAVLPCDCESESSTISWFKDGVPVNSRSNRINITENGMLSITDLNKKEDTGLYTCVASSKTGKTSWSGYLRLESPTNPNIKFYRSPESSAFPGQPGKPQIIEKTDNSCTISWSPTTKLGASSILGYRVEFFGMFLKNLINCIHY